MTLPLVYIAAPYGSDPVGNTRRAVEAGMGLYRLGVAVPLIPHTSLVADLVCPMSVADWYAYDLHLLERCDAVWRLPGESKGADAEVVYALERGIPVFGERDALLAWAGEWEPADLDVRLADASHRAITATEEARVAKGILGKLIAEDVIYRDERDLMRLTDYEEYQSTPTPLSDAEAALFDTITTEART